MSRAIAYRMQEKVFGGLKPSIQRILDRARETEGNDHRGAQRRRASAGTLLIREWHGVKHRVTVLIATSSTVTAATSRSRKWPVRSPAPTGLDLCSSD
jgi:hypothetical protein